MALFANAIPSGDGQRGRIDNISCGRMLHVFRGRAMTALTCDGGGRRTRKAPAVFGKLGFARMAEQAGFADDAVEIEQSGRYKPRRNIPSVRVVPRRRRLYQIIARLDNVAVAGLARADLVGDWIFCGEAALGKVVKHSPVSHGDVDGASRARVQNL